MSMIRYHTADVDGLKIFYREAGRAAAPDVVAAARLSDQQPHVSNLIPLLADRFHIVAPDLPDSDNPTCRRMTHFPIHSPS